MTHARRVQHVDLQSSFKPGPPRQPVFLIPAATPLTVTRNALRSRWSPSAARSRRSSSTCTRLIGSTYGLRTSIDRRSTGLSSSRLGAAGDGQHRRRGGRKPASQVRAERVKVGRHQHLLVVRGDARRRPWPAPSRSGPASRGRTASRRTSAPARRARRPRAPRRALRPRRATRAASAASGSTQTPTGSRAASRRLRRCGAAPAGWRW